MHSTTGLRDRAWKVLGRLPRLSAGATRFLAVLAKRDVEPNELTSIIQRDPMLAPSVLELANSGVFGRLRRVESVQHAVVLVGVSTLRRHGLRWTIGGLFRGLQDLQGWSTARFTMHSEAVALLTDLLCDHIPIPGEDGAFIAGLVHDIGKFVICAEAASALEVIRALRETNAMTVAEAEREVLGIDHAELSSMAALRWQLPEEVCHAIQLHHEPYRDDSTPGIPLSFVLSKADALVNGLGLDFLSMPEDATTSLEWPGYEDEVERALKQFEASLKNSSLAV